LQLARVLGPAMRATGTAAALALPGWRAAKWRHFASNPELEQGYRALRGFFMPEELAALAGPALSDAAAAARAELAAVEQRLFAPAGEETPPASVARLETRMFLGSQLLRDVDAVSMAHALEVRVPFVDHVLQATVWPSLGRHPHLLKRKQLLHDTLAKPLPADIVGLPKRGFTLPFERWMRAGLKDTTRAGLDALAERGWLDRAAPDLIWTAWDSGQAHWSRAWGLGLLGRFLEEAA
jgi:asparagine synthase (glutamine-hydrolysing)